MGKNYYSKRLKQFIRTHDVKKIFRNASISACTISFILTGVLTLNSVKTRENIDVLKGEVIEEEITPLSIKVETPEVSIYGEIDNPELTKRKDIDNEILFRDVDTEDGTVNMQVVKKTKDKLTYSLEEYTGMAKSMYTEAKKKEYIGHLCKKIPLNKDLLQSCNEYKISKDKVEFLTSRISIVKEDNLKNQLDGFKDYSLGKIIIKYKKVGYDHHILYNGVLIISQYTPEELFDLR